MNLNFKGIFKEFRHDFPASIVVFFVAMPLCLGIALASGAPLFAGIIAGVVGGIVVGSASGSALGVSGPAAGLAVIVLGAIATLGWEPFLLAVMISGIIQLIMGYLRLGIIAYYFPTSVIKGMLAGIGLIIVLKQIPHALGYDADYEGDLSFITPGGANTFEQLVESLQVITPGALLISVISLALLILWDKVLTAKHKIFKLLQGPIVVVGVGIFLNYLFISGALPFSLSRDQIVDIPVADNMQEFFGQFTLPDFSHLTNPAVYFTAIVIAIIASLETLLCVEATDKLDPYKRVTPTNRELKAQGIGNMFSGLIGGLPVTQVIVRSSANITFGGRTKLSAIMHGFFLLICAYAIPQVLNMVPLASLAAILLIVGYKLAKPSLFKYMYKLGWDQFIPFVATVFAIVFSDLLTGIGIGLVVAVFYILRNHYRNPYVAHKSMEDGRETYSIILAEEISFLNKGSLLKAVKEIPESTRVIIDGTQTKAIDHDVIEIISDFMINADRRDIDVELIGIKSIEKRMIKETVKENR